jgi:hypothetical protein
MSKSAKSKNATLKKVRKLERQGKYLKALKVCDDYLDNSIAEESLILLKIDILVEYYNNDDFIGLINEYKIKLTRFLSETDEIELLKIYNTLDNYLELKTQNLASEGIVKSYIAGGLLIDNLETILVLNEIVKDNFNSLSDDEKSNETTIIPQDLESFVENILKTSYQYLELILDNPKEQIANSKFDLEKIRLKLRHFLEPKEEETIDSVSKEPNVETDEDTNIQTSDETVDDELILEEISELEERSVITLEEIARLDEESEDDLLEAEDNNEIAMEYSVEDEIQGLKDIITYLNTKNEFRKALIYQRRLVKLGRKQNIKSKIEMDSKQRTLSEF